MYQTEQSLRIIPDIHPFLHTVSSDPAWSINDAKKHIIHLHS